MVVLLFATAAGGATATSIDDDDEVLDKKPSRLVAVLSGLIMSLPQLYMSEHVVRICGPCSNAPGMPNVQTVQTCLGVLTFFGTTSQQLVLAYHIRVHRPYGVSYFALLSVEVDIWFSPRAKSGQRAKAGGSNTKLVRLTPLVCPSPPGKSS